MQPYSAAELRQQANDKDREAKAAEQRAEGELLAARRMSETARQMRERARLLEENPPDECPHPAPVSGPRVPLFYGSAATLVCGCCGAYRLDHHGLGPWKPGPPDTSDPDDE